MDERLVTLLHRVQALTFAAERVMRIALDVEPVDDAHRFEARSLDRSAELLDVVRGTLLDVAAQIMAEILRHPEAFEGDATHTTVRAAIENMRSAEQAVEDAQRAVERLLRERSKLAPERRPPASKPPSASN